MKLPRDRSESIVCIRGHWTPTVVAGVKTAWVSCPKCARGFSLEDHAIGDDGIVVPPVHCRAASCGWSAKIQLEGWPA